MSRDALLVILAVVVIANFAFLAEVAVLNRRRSASVRRGAMSAAAATSAAVATSTVEIATGPRLVPVPVAPAAAVTPPVAERVAEPDASDAGAMKTPDPVAAPPELSEPKADAGGKPAASSTAAKPGEPMTRRSRTRRFALPQMDEDRGRTEAAINAFLGEPSLTAGSPQQHRPRRRSRRQRTPGEVVAPMVVVASLAGWEELRKNGGPQAASRFSEALASTLRHTLRAGDELMELGGGRLRIVVHADEEGARALIGRATTICDPWLRAAPVPLELRARAIDPSASRPPTSAAAAGNGAGHATAAAPLPFPPPGSRNRATGGITPPGDGA
jgi:hypothetical protein